jgi:hypothetical protein
VNFDWYGASVETGADEVLGEMSRAFDMASPETVRGMWGFNRAVALRRGDRSLATVMWEGHDSTGTAGCYVQGTGREAAAIANFLRGRNWVHRVSRVDVAEDYTGDGTWERLSRLTLDVADEHGVKVEHAGDWHRGEAGRTLYVGGRQSVVRECVYEKGRQLGTDPNHVRMELRVRPHGLGKVLASKSSPMELYGSSRWSLDLSERLGHPDVQRLSLGTVYGDDDKHRARQWLLKQYGHTLRGLETECGSWSAVGEWIGEELSKP